jgi:hypothetical protein
MVRTVAVAILLLLFAVLAWRPVTDPDFALHAAGGRWIAENRTVPDTDPFTYTLSDRPYLAYHWLFQLTSYGVLEAFGGTGLTAVRWLGLLVTALLLLDVLRMRRCSTLAGAVVGLAAILMIEDRFRLRPELATYLLSATTLWVLERARGGRFGTLWLLPAIQILWVNTHLFVVGWIIMFIYLGDEVIRRRSWPSRLGGWIAAALLATLLNPYHYHAVLYPLLLATRMQASNVFAEWIDELASPLSLLLTTPAEFVSGPQVRKAYGLLLAFGLVAVPLHLRRRRLADAGIVLVFVGLSLSAVRNGGLYALVAAPALCTALDEVGRSASRRWSPRALNIIAATLLGSTLALAALTTASVVRGAYYLDGLRPERFTAGLCDTCLATRSGDWVAQSGLVGPGFNNFNMGSTLIWRDPGRKIFIDARNEVTGEEFMREYIETNEIEGWRRAQRRYGFEYVVLRYNADVNALSLARHLDQSPGWQLVHADGNAVIFARADGPNDSLPPAALPAGLSPDERRRRLAALRPEGARHSAFFRWLWSNEPTPGAASELGTLLLFLGRLDQAEAPLLAAAERCPGSAEVHNNLGELYWRRRFGPAALAAYRNALALGLDGEAMRTARSRVERLESRFD